MLDSLSSLQVSLAGIGGLTLLAVVIYNYWTSRKNAPRQAEPQTEPLPHLAAGLEASEPQEPVLTDDFASLPQPERKAQLDALIDVIAMVDVDQPVSGDAALAALPSTRRVGTKPFNVEGCSQLNGEWEPLLPGRRYSAFQAGVQLANRMGALNEIEFSEFVVKTQAFADAVNGTATFSDMLEEVARARELDQFASDHDAQLGFVLRAKRAAWSPSYIQQTAARLGFVMGSMAGRLVIPASGIGLPPVVSLNFDTLTALADDPTQSALRQITLGLDVAQVDRSEKPFERLRELADTVPKKEIEAAESEVASLSGRMAAVGGGLNNREALIAPVSGVIALSNAVIGQVVEPRELIFELVDPDSLHVEALAYEVLMPDQVASATLAAGGKSVALNFIGASRRLREQSLPLMFENHEAGAGLALPLGLPVKVQVQLKAQVSGLPVPLAALSRSQANEVMVWVKVAPERFVPRAVQTTPFDGVRVMVTQGLAAGDRVVVQGANLISQVR